MAGHRILLKVLFASTAVIAFAGWACVTAHAQENPVNLTLQQAVKMAVEKNLDVKAELYNPAAAEADIRGNTGIYDPLLTFQTTYQESATQSPNAFTSGGVQINREKYLQLDPGISQLIPYGGTLGLTFLNTWYRNNYNPTVSLNDYWQSELALTFVQPLLRNFGREVTELNISVARFNKEGLMEQFKSKLISTVAQVRIQYYQLYSLRENLDVRKTSLALAEKILSDTKAQVRAGVLPAMEILNAEFGVATMQKNLIDAERAVKDQEDSLRLLLQLPAGADIVPVDTPFTGSFDVDTAASIRKALVTRPDLKQLQVTLKTSELQSKVARNQTLPELNFSASSSLTGLDQTYRRDVERVAGADYPVWNVGLQFSYPLGNRTAENAYIKSRLKVDQTGVQVKSLEETIATDVRNSARALQSSYKQLDVTARGSAYAEQVLEAYIKKQKVGLATSKDVLDEENNLVTAKGNRIQAVADYNNAITSLWQATGELLEKQGINVNEKDADSLYEKKKNE